MNRKLILAGAASALLLGGVAIAQTTSTQNTQDPAAAPSTAPNSATRDNMTAAPGSAATDANRYGADTAAQAPDTYANDRSTQMAGERG